MSILTLEIQYCTWPSQVFGQAWWQGQMEVILRSAARCGVRVLGFACGVEMIRVVAKGDRSAFRNQQRGLKVGVRHLAKRCQVKGLRWVDTIVREHPSVEVPEWVDWAHHLVDVSLANAIHRQPCTSYWDYRRLRRHHLFKPLERLLQQPVTDERSEKYARDKPTLRYILSVSAFVLGLQDANPKSFALFVALTKKHGYTHYELAKALCLTERRIRQPTHVPTPNIETAYRFLKAAHIAQSTPTGQQVA